MMEAARTSETSVDIQLRARQYIPEDSELHTRRRENLKSHKSFEYFIKNNNTKWRNQFFFPSSEISTVFFYLQSARSNA
jgi:hypothetical protein